MQMKVFCEDVYERNLELDAAKEKDLLYLVRQALTYKMGSIRFGVCLGRSFEKKGL